MTIQERARELVQLCGTSVQARERIIESLMAEFGRTPDSAIQHIASAKRHLFKQRTGGIRDKNRIRRIRAITGHEIRP